MSKVEASCGSDDKKSRKESVEEETELNELSAEEKKLVNQMYDKKGNLTPLGKKVMNHGKKPGDKGYIESVELDEISPELMKSYKKKAMKQYKQSARQKEVGGIGGTTKQATADKHMKIFMKRHKGIGSAIKRQGGSPKTNRDPKANSMTGKPAPYQNESVELDEISRSMTPMKNKFGGTVIPKKFDAYKKFVKKNNVDEPTVRMICDNPDAAESKRMMKNPKIAQAVDLYKAAHMKKESVSEKKKYLSQKDIKRAIASIKPPKKKPTLPKAPWDKKESTLPPAPGGKKSVRSADKKPVNVNVGGKTVTRMEPVTKRTAAAYESVNRKNWVDVLQTKKLQEAEDAKTKTSAPTGNHKSDDATRDTYDKQLATRKGEKDFVDMHNPETPEYADVNRVLPKTFAAFTAGVKAGGGKTNDAPGDKAMPKNDGK